MMSAIFLRAGVDLVHRRDHLRRPPRRRAAATSAAELASWLAWRARVGVLAARCRSAAPSTRRSAAGCAACSSVRWLRSWLPVAICVDGGADRLGALAHLGDHAAQLACHRAQRLHQLRRPRRGRRCRCPASGRPRRPPRPGPTAVFSGAVMARAIAQPSAAAKAMASARQANTPMRLPRKCRRPLRRLPWRGGR